MAFSTADWWNANYTYRRVISITAPGGESVPAGYSCELTEDTAALVTAGKVLASRNDWRIVYWAGGVNTELDRHYASAASTWFKIQAEITAGATSTSYFVYYGYSSASAPTVDYTDVYIFGDDFEDGDVTGWSTSLTSGNTFGAITPSAISGTYCSRVETADPVAYDTDYWWKDITATTTDLQVVLQATLRITRDHDHSHGNMAMYAYSGTTLLCSVSFYLNGSVNIWPNPVAARSWVKDTNYIIALTMKPATDKYSCTIDGAAEATDEAAGAAFTSVSRLKFLGVPNSGNYIYCDDVIIRYTMATAPTVTDADEAQLVTKTATIVYDCGTTTEITKTATIVFDVWAATITKAPTIVFDLLNQITKTATIVYDVQTWTWDGQTFPVVMCPSSFTVKMNQSTYPVAMCPSTFHVQMTNREM